MVFQDGFEDPITTPLLCGDLLSGSIDAANEADFFSCTGNTGDHIAIALVETGGDFTVTTVEPQFTLFTPTGVVVGTFTANTTRLFTLGESGSYFVRVRAENLTTTGTYNIGLECLPP